MAKWAARPGPAQAWPCLGRGQLGRHGTTGTSCRAVPSHGLHLRPKHGPQTLGSCHVGPKARPASPLGSCQPRHDKPVTSHLADLCTNILNQNSEVLISQIESKNFNNNSFTKFQKITSHMSKKLHAQITDALFTIFESIQSYIHSFIHWFRQITDTRQLFANIK